MGREREGEEEGEDRSFCRFFVHNCRSKEWNGVGGSGWGENVLKDELGGQGFSNALRSNSAESHPLKSQSLQPGELCLYLGQPRI